MNYIDPRSKLLAHLPALAALQNGATPAPINVEIDLTNRCSLGCEWCHFAYTHTRGPLAGKRDKPTGAILGGDVMSWELGSRALDELATAGVQSVTWTGGGEPTLHPHFARFVQHAADVGIRQGIYTHGGHLDHTKASVLKQHATFVYVSLDAVDRVSYRLAKGVDRFEQALEGITRTVSAPGNATIGVGYLITRENWQAAPLALELANRLGVDYIQYRPTIRYSQEHPDRVNEDTEWVWDAIELLRDLQRRPRVEVDLTRFSSYADWHGHGYPTCYWSGLQTVITPNGKVWTCVNKREHPAALLGDLGVESFQRIWERRPLAKVDGSCRVLCRGHVANVALAQLLDRRATPHDLFV